MKIHKLTILIVDYDNLGAAGVKTKLESANFAKGRRGMTQSLHDYAAAQVDAIIAEQGPPGDDRAHMIDRWTRRLISVGDIPDDILEAMPEVSRHNEPQVSPQEYECGCVTVTRITDRDYRYDEKPFEMRLARPCDSASCQRTHPPDEPLDELNDDRSEMNEPSPR